MQIVLIFWSSLFIWWSSNSMVLVSV